METALGELTARSGSRSDAVRYAVLHAHEQANRDAERFGTDPDDRTETPAFQRSMGVAE